MSGIPLVNSKNTQKNREKDSRTLLAVALVVQGSLWKATPASDEPNTAVKFTTETPFPGAAPREWKK